MKQVFTLLTLLILGALTLTSCGHGGSDDHSHSHSHDDDDHKEEMVDSDKETATSEEDGTGSISTNNGDKIADVGETVSVHYVGTLDDGEQFDSSRDRGEPFQFTLGQGVIEGFTSNISGMKVGETKTFTIPKEEAYYDFQEITTERTRFDDEYDLTVGADLLSGEINDTIDVAILQSQFQIEGVAGETFGNGTFEGEVISVSEGQAIVKVKDSSAPFAGKELTVGATATDPVDGNTLEITGVSEDGLSIDLHVINTANPFKDAELKEGAYFTAPNNTTYEVAAIGEEEVTLRQFSHPLGGLPLTFEVELLEIVE